MLIFSSDPHLQPLNRRLVPFVSGISSQSLSIILKSRRTILRAVAIVSFKSICGFSLAPLSLFDCLVMPLVLVVIMIMTDVIVIIRFALLVKHMSMICVFYNYQLSVN